MPLPIRMYSLLALLSAKANLFTVMDCLECGREFMVPAPQDIKKATDEVRVRLHAFAGESSLPYSLLAGNDLSVPRLWKS